MSLKMFLDKATRQISEFSEHPSYILIVYFITIPMFKVKYLGMHKVQMHADTISKLLFGFASTRAIIQALK